VTASKPPPQTRQPIGEPVGDPSPAPRPAAVTLVGRYGRVKRLAPARHGSDLWNAFQGHDEIWAYMSAYGPFANAVAFQQWLASREQLVDPYYYTIVDTSGRALGLSTLMEIRPEHRSIEVGHIVYSPVLQRTPLATETQYLLAAYVFDTLGYRRYEWKCNALNSASRRAALRFGFRFEGILRQHMIAKGRNRDTAYFSMLDSEWPARKAAFERWLAQKNFDKQGQQKTRLNAGA